MTDQFLQHCFNNARREARTVAELIGIARGLSCDDILTDGEIEFLIQWLESNSHLSQSWPFDVVYERISLMLEDGIIDDEERAELLALLKDLVGGKAAVKKISSFASTLPLTKPCPEIRFNGCKFCFTGNFAFGTRKDCEKAVSQQGAIICDRITKNLDYLVVGLMGNEDWAQSSFGRKIQTAAEYNEKGCHILIIGEDDWANAVIDTI